MFTPVFWWVIVGIGLMLCEFAVPGLILFFFGLGALVTAVACWPFDPSLTTQLIIFAAASLVSLFGLRRLLKPVFMGGSSGAEGSMTEGMAGREAKVTEPIAPGAAGKVVMNGVAWKAESDGELDVGRAVVVIDQHSLTLIVKGK